MVGGGKMVMKSQKGKTMRDSKYLELEMAFTEMVKLSHLELKEGVCTGE